VRASVVVHDRRLAQWGGYAAVAFGSWLLWQAYEARGRHRPFAAKFLPGP
jgi:hypothetical protein